MLIAGYDHLAQLSPETGSREAAHLLAQTLFAHHPACSDDIYIHKGSIKLTLHDLNILTF